MSDELDDFRETVWRGVAHGETDFLTRREMAEVLREVADDIEPSHA